LNAIAISFITIAFIKGTIAKGNWFKLIQFKRLLHDEGSIDVGSTIQIMMKVPYVLNCLIIALVTQPSEQTEALNTGNSNEWYTEPGIWLFILIFIFVITLVVYRKLTKKN